MGSGASSRSKAKNSPVQSSGPALQRRRKVLLCSVEPRQFEGVAVRDQFRAIPEDVKDPVFCRLPGGLAEANEFRIRCEGMQLWQDEGYLSEHAMELLGLGLMPGSALCRRLYRVAQCQQILPGPRRPKLTCYELLALNSLLKGGTKEDLLELLFCVFDADGDDKVGKEDLLMAIDAFLQLEEASACFAGDELKDFRKLDAKARKAEATRLAEGAVKDYGKVEEDVDEEDVEAEEEEQEEEEAEEEKTKEAKEKKEGDESKESTAPSPPEPSKSSKEAGSDDDAKSDASARSHHTNDSKTPHAGDLQKSTPAKKGGGLCRGKAPKEEPKPKQEGEPKPEDGKKEDEKKEDEEATAKAKPKAKPKRRGGLCSSSKQEETSASEAETVEKKAKEAAAKAKAKAKAAAAAKAKAKAKAKERARSKGKTSCFGSAPKPQPLAFHQWAKWLLASGLLPEGLAEAVASVAASAAQSAKLAPLAKAAPSASAAAPGGSAVAASSPAPRAGTARSDDTSDEELSPTSKARYQGHPSDSPMARPLLGPS